MTFSNRMIRLQKHIQLPTLGACHIIAFAVITLNSASATGFVDPTKPSGYVNSTPRTTTAYRLESVLTGQNRRVAIINGKNFAIGDRMPLGKIHSISKERVVIVGKRRHILEIGAKPIKQYTEVR